jgi:hypothetical protein
MKVMTILRRNSVRLNLKRRRMKESKSFGVLPTERPREPVSL